MKVLIDKKGNLTKEARVIIGDIVDSMTPLFEDYMEKGYNIFEVLGVMTSALINAQKQAWINKVINKE